MYNVNRQPIHKVKSKIYIANRLRTEQDDDLNQYEVFDTPKKYLFNVQVANTDSEIREFGELANKMLSVTIAEKSKYINKFNEFDKVYVNTTPENEYANGENADYRIYSVRNQNTTIKIYLQKLVK